jgi:hypothetical protein
MFNQAAIDEQVDMGVLHEIHEQYVNLARRHGAELPEFGESNLASRESFVVFQEYLSGLTEILRRENWLEECDQCDNGRCPPCNEWGRTEHVNYLNDLKRKTQ